MMFPEKEGSIQAASMKALVESLSEEASIVPAISTAMPAVVRPLSVKLATPLRMAEMLPDQVKPALSYASKAVPY